MAELESEQPATPALLTSRIAAAAHQYALKNYAEAADLYSQASVMQAEINGEMATQNAELLYAYGRCLHKVAVEKSDVLGGRVAGPTGGEGKQPRGTKRKAGDDDATANGTTTQAKSVQNGAAATQESSKESKPYFQIEGDDEDWDEDDEEDTAGADGEVEEEEDDFATAYEILDTARVLFMHRLEAMEEAVSGTVPDGSDDKLPTSAKGNGKEKATNGHSMNDAPLNNTSNLSISQPNAQTSEKRHIQDLLADTYDIQSEINLENERFPDAASDAKASLALKVAAVSFDSSLVAEAHYKVSLALEFAAKTTTEKPDELTGEMTKEIEGVDEDLLRESANHMEKAIESTKLRVKREDREAQECQDEDERRKKEKEVQEVKEILADMEERLKDLRGVPNSLSIAALQDPNAPDSASDGPRSILSALLGESSADARAKIAEATKTANDLTGLVRHRKKGITADAGSTNGTSGTAKTSHSKRKAEEVTQVGSDKRAKVEDADGVDELA